MPYWVQSSFPMVRFGGNAMLRTCALMSSLLLSALVLQSVARCQEAKEENIHFEQLKVLEPIIGTWTFTWPGLEPAESTYAWSTGKKMVVARYRSQNAEPGKSLESELGYADNSWAFCVWNAKEKCIELHTFMPFMGTCTVSKVTPKGNGEFEIVPVRMSGNGGSYTMSWTITEKEILTRMFNRTDRQGQALEDIEIHSSRVK